MCGLLSMTVEMKRDCVNFNLMPATMLSQGDDDDNHDDNSDDNNDDNNNDNNDDNHNDDDDNNCTAVLLAAESDADFYLPPVSVSSQPTTGISR